MHTKDLMSEHQGLYKHWYDVTFSLQYLQMKMKVDLTEVTCTSSLLVNTQRLVT